MPYRSQEDPDARRYRNDCGAVCVGMCLDWLGVHITSDALSAMTTLSGNDTGLRCDQLAALFNRVISQTGFNVRAAVRVMDLNQIRAELDAGRPVVPLISYREIPDRMAAFGGGHFVVVRGYDSDAFYVNDPDWWMPRRAEGENFRVGGANLDRAIRRSDAPGQCVVFSMV